MNNNKILLVDKDPELLNKTKLLLMAKGYEVVTATSAEAGWRLFLSEKPDAAVLGLILEEHDSGFILSYKIKKNEHGKNIPVYILTCATYLTGYKFGASTSEEKEWIRCDEIINKPVIIDDLIQKIENYYLMKCESVL